LLEVARALGLAVEIRLDLVDLPAKFTAPAAKTVKVR
jgi:hypothetical protein